MNFDTEYLGLSLKSPIIAGASPLVDNLDNVRRLEEAGAGAIVMHSLFEEQILLEDQAGFMGLEMHEGSFGEALSFMPLREDFELTPHQYLSQIRKIKDIVSIPLIASLNGSTPGGWVEYASLIEQAGADALELNFYQLTTDPNEPSEAVESRACELLKSIRKNVGLPIAVKLSPYFSALPHFAKSLVDAGANGLVLFNRFYQPDIDCEELAVKPSLELSTSSELRLRLRWLAILSAKLLTSYASSGGVHKGLDAVKAIMCGAHVVQVVSCLLKNGPQYLATVLKELGDWMEAHEYEDLDQLRCCMNLKHTPDPAAFERSNYLRVLQSWKFSGN